MTFTKDKNETDAAVGARRLGLRLRLEPRGAASARDQNQLYLMRPDGGEARKITDAKDGVSTFAFSKDGKWLVYRSGKAGEEQLYRLPVDGIDTAKAEQLTKQASRRGRVALVARRRRIYFVGPDTVDKADEKARREKKFTVDIRNAETPLAHLWAVDARHREGEAA